MRDLSPWLRESDMQPALPLSEAGIYVAGAYLVFVVLVVVYVFIISAKISRIERDVQSLHELMDARHQ
jgi:type II secretory pathway component PulM